MKLVFLLLAAFPGCCCVEKAIEVEMDMKPAEMHIMEEAGEILVEKVVEKVTGYDIEPFMPAIEEPTGCKADLQ